jgi:hypothetical protein
VPDCYYQSKPIEGLEVTVFKTLKDLQEHSRDAHESPKRIASLSSQLQLQPLEEQNSIVCRNSADVTEPWLPDALFDPAIDLDPLPLDFLEGSSWDTFFSDLLPFSSQPTPYSIVDHSSQSHPLTASRQESWSPNITSKSKPECNPEAPSMVLTGRTGPDNHLSPHPSIA